MATLLDSRQVIRQVFCGLWRGDEIFFLDLTLFTNLECDTQTAIYEPISAISIFTRSLRRHAFDSYGPSASGIDSWPTPYHQRP